MPAELPYARVQRQDSLCKRSRVDPLPLASGGVCGGACPSFGRRVSRSQPNDTADQAVERDVVADAAYTPFVVGPVPARLPRADPAEGLRSELECSPDHDLAGARRQSRRQEAVRGEMPGGEFGGGGTLEGINRSFGGRMDHVGRLASPSYHRPVDDGTAELGVGKHFGRTRHDVMARCRSRAGG